MELRAENLKLSDSGMLMETASSLHRKQMNSFTRAEQNAESQGEVSAIREARLQYLKRNLRLLILHAEAQKKRKVYSMDVLGERCLKSGARDKYYQYRLNIDPNYIRIKETVCEDNLCSDCGELLLQDLTRALMVCESCGPRDSACSRFCRN